MIIDQETNKLYLSNLLEKEYPLFYTNFKKELDRHGIITEYLLNTKDVWCVDFMPVQIGITDFLQFNFFPTYLRPKKYANKISDPSTICNQLNLSPKSTDIIADGGNIVKTHNKVIMTTRVVTENPQYNFKQLTNKLTELLEVERLILIPEQPNDFTGHADGMIRFLDNNTVIINDYQKEPKKDFVLQLKTALHNAGLNIVEIPTSMYDNDNHLDATGDYINYLHMKDIIFLPVFNRPEDEKVIRQFESLFNGTKIVPVESNDLAKDGGVINCITWNIQE